MKRYNIFVAIGTTLQNAVTLHYKLRRHFGGPSNKNKNWELFLSLFCPCPSVVTVPSLCTAGKSYLPQSIRQCTVHRLSVFQRRNADALLQVTHSIHQAGNTRFTPYAVCVRVHYNPQFRKTTPFFLPYAPFILCSHCLLSAWAGILLPTLTSTALRFFNSHLKCHLLYLHYNIWLPPESNSCFGGIYNLGL